MGKYLLRLTLTVSLFIFPAVKAASIQDWTERLSMADAKILDQILHEIERTYSIDVGIHLYPTLPEDTTVENFVASQRLLTNEGVLLLRVENPPTNRVLVGYRLIRSQRLTPTDIQAIEFQMGQGLGPALHTLKKSLGARLWDRIYAQPLWTSIGGWAIFLFGVLFFLRPLYFGFLNPGNDPPHRHAMAALLCSYFGWSLIQFPHYWDPRLFLPGENASIQYAGFEYIALHLRHFGEWPVWVLGNKGGFWIESLAGPYGFLQPHRLCGVVIALITELPLNTVWKFSFLFLGQGMFLMGVYWLTRMLFLRSPICLMVSGGFVLGSLFIGPNYSEAALGSLIPLPYLWVAAIYCKRNPRLFPILGALSGLALTVGSPASVFSYFGLVLLLLLFIQTRPPILVSSITVTFFILSASPALYALSLYPLVPRASLLGAWVWSHALFLGLIGVANFIQKPLQAQNKVFFLAGALAFTSGIGLLPMILGVGASILLFLSQLSRPYRPFFVVVALGWMSLGAIVSGQDSIQELQRNRLERPGYDERFQTSAHFARSLAMEGFSIQIPYAVSSLVQPQERSPWHVLIRVCWLPLFFCLFVWGMRESGWRFEFPIRPYSFRQSTDSGSG